MKQQAVFIFVLFLALTACAGKEHQKTQNKPITTFIFVRHAEKVLDGSKNPPLTPEGEGRARTLAEMLDFVKVDKVYSTNYTRTISTVKPYADQKNISIEIAEARPSKEFFFKILDENAGKTILMSGHSNSTPTNINLLLGEERFQELDESVYDRLFIVTLTEIGDAKVIVLRYGDNL